MLKLPDQVDCIILGTSLTNSIVAAACSRIGKSILHVDTNDFYGNSWASFTFQQLVDWFENNHPENPSLQSLPQELIDKSRRFCIDLTPKFIFSNGPMVELLISSNVTRYHDFKNNIRILSKVNDEIHILPCKRSDVFNSNLFHDLLDKRRLMKFIESSVEYEDSSSLVNKNGSKQIKSYLMELGLSETLQQYVINSIAMVDPSHSTLDAAKKIKNFISSTECYGVSPFLFPLYGCGEYPQSFCRLSAVFGGTYCLNTKVTKVERGKDSFNLKLSDTNVTSEYLVLDQEYNSLMDCSPSSMLNQSYLARAIVITRKSILATNEADTLSFMRIPTNKTPIYFIELTSSVKVCPSEYRIIYIWTMNGDDNKLDPEEQLKPIMELLGNSEIVWKVFWNHPCLCDRDSSLEQPPVHNSHDKQFFTNAPSFCDIDYANEINEAKRIFHQICPDAEFLPRAPDPGEIINY